MRNISVDCHFNAAFCGLDMAGLKLIDNMQISSKNIKMIMAKIVKADTKMKDTAPKWQIVTSS